MSTTHGPPQRQLRSTRQQRRGKVEHTPAPGEHLGVDHIGLVLAGDRAAQPRRMTRLHQRQRTARRAHRVPDRKPRHRRGLAHDQRRRVRP
jgi:hypothetical protein